MSAPQVEKKIGRALLLDISALPKHCVLYALWSAACPDVTVVPDAKPFRTALDAKTYLEPRNKTRYLEFVAGRAVCLDLARDRWNPSVYDTRNGKGVARFALNQLRRYLQEFSAVFGSAEEGLRQFEKAVARGFQPHFARVYPPGRQLLDDILAGATFFPFNKAGH